MTSESLALAARTKLVSWQDPAELLAAGDGEAVFACTPDESTYNPMGIVHGGLLCTLLDTAAGCLAARERHARGRRAGGPYSDGGSTRRCWIRPGPRPGPRRTGRHLSGAVDLLRRPVAGSAVATAAILTWGRRPVTGKLCHDPSIACHMRCGLPHRIQVAALTDDHGAARR